MWHLKAEWALLDRQGKLARLQGCARSSEHGCRGRAAGQRQPAGKINWVCSEHRTEAWVGSVERCDRNVRKGPRSRSQEGDTGHKPDRSSVPLGLSLGPLSLLCLRLPRACAHPENTYGGQRLNDKECSPWWGKGDVLPIRLEIWVCREWKYSKIVCEGPPPHSVT